MARKRRKRPGMYPCPAVTKAGKPCPNNGHVRDGCLCHVHREMPEWRLIIFLRAGNTGLGYERVQCEAVLEDGRRCGHMIRAMYGPVCVDHGGGRQGCQVYRASVQWAYEQVR